MGLAALSGLALYVVDLGKGEERASNSPSQAFTEAHEALVFFARQRAYPQAVLPRRGYGRAFQETHARTRKRDNAPVRGWEAIGPHNVSGRILTLAYNPENPNTLYAGSASGGLWRSYTAGVGEQAWRRVATGHPVLGVGAIAISPTDSNTIYIGTGEVYSHRTAQGGVAIRETRGSFGIGILKSQDGGQTWVKSLDWSRHQQTGIQRLKINPVNPDEVWAATSEGVYVSRDAGVRWTSVLDVAMATDLVINPVDPRIVLAACGNLGSAGRGVYRTQDGGTTWETLLEGFPLPEEYFGKIRLDRYAGDPNLIYASVGIGSGDRSFDVGGSGNHLVLTRNGGDTWERIETFNYAGFQGWYSHYVAIHPTNANKLFLGGIIAYKSSDGGRTRSGSSGSAVQEGHFWVDQHDIFFHPEDPDIVYFANDGGVYRTTDGGSTYEGLNGGLQTTQFYKGTSHGRRDSLLIVGGAQDRYSWIRDGLAWRRIGGGDGTWTAIDPRDEDWIYFAAQRLTLYRSEDRGASWELLAIPGAEERLTSFVAPFVLAPSDPDVLYAGRDVIYKSRTRGATWEATNGRRPLDGNPALSMAVSRTNANVVIVGTAPIHTRAGVFRTVDGGATWTNITATLPDRYPLDVQFDPGNEEHIYVVFSGFGTSHVFKSTNQGESWEDIGTGLLDIPTSALVVDPLFPDTLFVGNDLGVYVSKNGGARWTPFTEGLPEAVIAMDLAVSPMNRKLRVATHGNGMYEYPLSHAEDSTPTFSDPVPVPDGSQPALLPNYPNPFRATTTITYQLVEAAYVHLAIYDLTGRRVATLVDRPMVAGRHQVVFEPEGLAAGTYLCTMQIGDRSFTRSLTLSK